MNPEEIENIDDQKDKWLEKENEQCFWIENSEMDISLKTNTEMSEGAEGKQPSDDEFLTENRLYLHSVLNSFDKRFDICCNSFKNLGLDSSPTKDESKKVEKPSKKGHKKSNKRFNRSGQPRDDIDLPISNLSAYFSPRSKRIDQNTKKLHETWKSNKVLAVSGQDKHIEIDASEISEPISEDEESKAVTWHGDQHDAEPDKEDPIPSDHTLEMFPTSKENNLKSIEIDRETFTKHSKPSPRFREAFEIKSEDIEKWLDRNCSQPRVDSMITSMNPFEITSSTKSQYTSYVADFMPKKKSKKSSFVPDLKSIGSMEVSFTNSPRVKTTQEIDKPTKSFEKKNLIRRSISENLQPGKKEKQRNITETQCELNIPLIHQDNLRIFRQQRNRVKTTVSRKNRYAIVENRVSKKRDETVKKNVDFSPIIKSLYHYIETSHQSESIPVKKLEKLVKKISKPTFDSHYNLIGKAYIKDKATRIAVDNFIWKRRLKELKRILNSALVNRISSSPTYSSHKPIGKDTSKPMKFLQSPQRPVSSPGGLSNISNKFPFDSEKSSGEEEKPVKNIHWNKTISNIAKNDIRYISKHRGKSKKNKNIKDKQFTKLPNPQSYSESSPRFRNEKSKNNYLKKSSVTFCEECKRLKEGGQNKKRSKSAVELKTNVENFSLGSSLIDNLSTVFLVSRQGNENSIFRKVKSSDNKTLVENTAGSSLQVVEANTANKPSIYKSESNSKCLFTLKHDDQKSKTTSKLNIKYPKNTESTDFHPYASMAQASLLNLETPNLNNSTLFNTEDLKNTKSHEKYSVKKKTEISYDAVSIDDFPKLSIHETLPKEMLYKNNTRREKDIPQLVEVGVGLDSQTKTGTSLATSRKCSTPVQKKLDWKGLARKYLNHTSPLNIFDHKESSSTNEGVPHLWEGSKMQEVSQHKSSIYQTTGFNVRAANFISNVTPKVTLDIHVMQNKMSKLDPQECTFGWNNCETRRCYNFGEIPMNDSETASLCDLPRSSYASELFVNENNDLALKLKMPQESVIEDDLYDISRRILAEQETPQAPSEHQSPVINRPATSRTKRHHRRPKQTQSQQNGPNLTRSVTCESLCPSMPDMNRKLTQKKKKVKRSNDSECSFESNRIFPVSSSSLLSLESDNFPVPIRRMSPQKLGEESVSESNKHTFNARLSSIDIHLEYSDIKESQECVEITLLKHQNQPVSLNMRRGCETSEKCIHCTEATAEIPKPRPSFSRLLLQMWQGLHIRRLSASKLFHRASKSARPASCNKLYQ